MDKSEQQIKGGKQFLDKANLLVSADGKVIGMKGTSDVGRQLAIRELALKIFQRRLNFVFKPDADPAHIDELVKSEPFQEYLQEAEKQYEKRQKSLDVNKNYPVIEVPADGKSGMMGGAYTLAFVYSKKKGNVVVKGYRREVEAYIKENFTQYFVNYSLWYLGSHRDIWEFWKPSINIFEPTRSSKRRKIEKKDRMFSVRPKTDWSWDVSDEEYKKQQKEADERTLYFRRMPKRWIPEFDNL